MIRTTQCAREMRHGRKGSADHAAPLTSMIALEKPMLEHPWPIVLVTLKGRTISPVVERFIACTRTIAKTLAKKK